MNDKSKPYLDELPFCTAHDNKASRPFSFTYGGRPCEEVLPSWRRSVVEESFPGKVQRTVSYTDPETDLCIEYVLTLYSEPAAADWVCYLTNRGQTKTPLIEQFLPLSAPLPVGPPDTPVTLRWSNGDTCSYDSFLAHDDPLEPGVPRRFAPVGGRSSNGAFPFFNIIGEHGGWIVAVGWSGQWAAEFTSTASGSVTVRAGIESTRFRLEPGERVRMPRIVLVRWRGTDPSSGHNLFRRLMLENYVRRHNGEPAAPPITHNMFGTVYQRGKPIDLEGLLATLNAAADRACEAYWVDAYWYPQPWYEHVGDWFPNPELFSRGLEPVSDASHGRAMKFVLWFEPERVAENTQWDIEHPEYLLKLPDNRNRLWNLGCPDARAFLTDFLDARIKEWGIDVYRQDFNFDPLPYWRNNDLEERQGLTEIHYIQGLYKMWDDLLERNPGLTIDNCAAGGRRLDIETCSRSYPLWRSDYNDIGEGLKGKAYWPYMARADQVHVAGLSLYLPFHTGPVWTETPYNWRSAAAAGIVLYGDIEGFSIETTRRAVEELKQLRPLFQGDFFTLLPVTTEQTDWHAYQFDSPDLGKGCALFFRRPDNPCATCDVELRSIDDTAVYEVTLTGETYMKPDPVRLSGADLKRQAVHIPEKPGSALLMYTKLNRVPCVPPRP